jgi:Fe-S oxidoreductase
MTPTREEFLYISHLEQILFYTCTYASLAIAGWQIWKRVKLWLQGRSNGKGVARPWSEQVSRGWENLRVYVLAQRKVRSSRPTSGAPMHLALFYGFLALFIGTTLLAVNTYSPIKFHKGLYYLSYELVLDVMGVVFILGLLWAFVRRVRMSQTQNNPLTTQTQDFLNLGLLFAVAVTGFWLEAARMSVNPQPFDWSAPVGHLWAQLQGPYSPGLYRFVWWFHMAWIWVFFAWLPQLRLRHLVLAIPSVAFAPEAPMGALQTIPMEEVEATGKIGVAEPQDFTQWQLLSTDACMECGRCTEVCPAHGVGKVLNPKWIVQGVKQAMETHSPVVPIVTEEALWACTTCNACVEACPVLIRQVDLIVDLRRNLVSEGKLSGSGATLLRQIGSNSNPWGKSDREAWMKGLDVPLARQGEPFEYLLWIGCAGATDPGAIKTSRALVQLFKKAGVSFACLGKEEACTADPARRVGDEFLFQEKAVANVAVFEKYGIKKVVTPCPHCFNTLKNEYGEFGATLEVVHHSQLLALLISEGRLHAAQPAAGEVTFHDPCYLARINNESDAPRAALGDTTEYNLHPTPGQTWLREDPEAKRHLAEPEHRANKTLCCGAGGGRMWLDEPANQRPSDRRMGELEATGAKTVAVACPFCRIMLGAATTDPSRAESLRLVDLAELVHEANL